MVNVHNSLRSFSVGPNVHVEIRIVENLQALIPAGIEVTESKMNIINFAITQLCEVDNPANIDWLALTNLAANICTLSGADK